MKDLFCARALWMVWLPVAGFAASIWLLGSENVISVLNAALFAIAAGVTVAFAPVAWDTLRGRTPLTSIFMLALGVHLAWSGTDVGRGWNIVWRLLGQPLWLANSWINALGLFLLCYGGICHLYAEEALEGPRVPAKKWVKWGIIVASAVFFVVLASYAVDRWAEAGIFDLSRIG